MKDHRDSPIGASGSSTRARRILFAAIPALVLVLLVGSGVMLGRYLAMRQTCKMIERHTKNRFLGGIVDEGSKADIARAYKDPAHALQNLDRYSWSPRNVPAPFVGSAPMPDEDSRIGINSMGLRGGHELAIPKPPGSYRIFITGGSTAYGSGAPDAAHTIAGYLQALLNQEFPPASILSCEVLTAANPAWTSTHERILIENRLSELEPDLVIAFSGLNDVHWGTKGANVMWLRTYTEDHFFTLVKTAYEQNGRPFARDVVQTHKGFVEPRDVVRNLKKNVALSAHALSLGEVPYHFMLQPALLVTDKPLSEREERHKASVSRQPGNIGDYFRHCYGLIRETLSTMREPSLKFTDLSGAFDQHGSNDEIFLDSYHFGDRGNEIIARAILNTIRSSIETFRAERQGS